MQNKIIPKLKYGSTWKLFFLGLITYGVYLAHFIKNKTSVINEHCEEGQRISSSFIMFIIVINYLSLILFFPYLFVAETHPIAALSGLVDLICGITLVIWGFKARNRMNMILSAKKKESKWFHGGWTFFFTPLYFNFKVNTLDEMVEQVDGHQQI